MTKKKHSSAITSSRNHVPAACKELLAGHPVRHAVRMIATSTVTAICYGKGTSRDRVEVVQH
jgi:hypothetical protein